SMKLSSESTRYSTSMPSQTSPRSRPCPATPTFRPPCATTEGPKRPNDERQGCSTSLIGGGYYRTVHPPYSPDCFLGSIDCGGCKVWDMALRSKNALSASRRRQVRGSS